MTPDTVDEVDDLALANPSRRYQASAQLPGFPRKIRRTLLGWLLFAALVGVIADSRGRGAVRWWLLSVLISPLLGMVLIGLLPPLKRPTGAPAAAAGQLAQGAGVIPKGPSTYSRGGKQLWDTD